MSKKKQIEKIEKGLNWIGTVGVGLIAMVTPAFATTTNTYAQNGASWVLDGIFWVVIVLGIGWAGMSAVKRNITATIGILIGTAIICALCKNPTALQTLGTALKGIIGL